MSKTQELTVPTHLGLILDGNRRWARAHNLPVIEGHRQGFETMKTILKAAGKYDIRYVSAFIFSNENWKRSADEVKQLMKLFLWIIRHETAELNRQGIRLRVIGSKLRIGKALVGAIHKAEELTKDNTRGTLLLCLDYGGQQEIVNAIKQIMKKGIDADTVTPELITQYLYAPDIPPLDLVIRTSGEKRLSNFMLWESAYSELFFVNSYWPDFDEAEFDAALVAYSSTQRRFGT